MTTAPRTWVVGEVVTAAELNTEIRDQFTDILGTGTSYTPVWASSGTAPAIGNGTLVGRYKLVGKRCTATFRLTAGSGTTYGTGVYNFSLPVQAGSAMDWIGRAFIGDSSVGAAGYSQGTAFIGASGTAMNLYAGNVGGSSQVGATSPQTFANGDRIWASIDYETV